MMRSFAAKVSRLDRESVRLGNKNETPSYIVERVRETSQRRFGRFLASLLTIIEKNYRPLPESLRETASPLTGREVQREHEEHGDTAAWNR
jgi:hypothetical protein